MEHRRFKRFVGAVMHVRTGQLDIPQRRGAEGVFLVEPGVAAVGNAEIGNFDRVRARADRNDTDIVSELVGEEFPGVALRTARFRVEEAGSGELLPAEGGVVSGKEPVKRGCRGG